MNFELNEDCAIFFSAIDKIAATYKANGALSKGRFEYAKQLQHELSAGGYLGCAAEESLGLTAAAVMVYELAQLPVCVEVAASALIGALFCPELQSPLAIVYGDVKRPVRYLPVARAVIHVAENGPRIALLDADDVLEEESIFAYPMGRLKNAGALNWRELKGCSESRLVDLWRIGIAAELLGCLEAGLNAVVTHVTDRRQFDRPLGSFQAIQHRLAAAATAIQGGRWMTLSAAHAATSQDSAVAAGYAQGIATKIVYDLHQFMGAMGLTLEHPLHRWTYRAKLLRTELGGDARQLREYADLTWGIRSELSDEPQQ